jgi:hypothetical protein
MNLLNHRALLVLLLLLPACGQQLVEFSDARSDAGPAITSDAEPSGDTDHTVLTDTEATDDAGAPEQTVTGSADDPGQSSAIDASAGDAGQTEPGDSVTDVTQPTDTELDDAASTEPIDSLTDASVPTLPELGDSGMDGVMDGGADAASFDAGNADGSTDAGLLPTVVSTSPAEDALGVSINKTIKATFSELMNGATIDGSSFTLQQGATPVPGTVSYSAAGASFVPDDSLQLGVLYTATITTDAKDADGNAMAQDFSWSFTTSACAMAPLDLGSAGNFAVLAGSTVTSTGLTSVSGDLGVSPGTAVVGFPPGSLIGDQHAGDPTAAQGILDLTNAYDDAAGRSLCAVTVDGNIGGLTLAPGLYASTSSLEISSGDLTLDALGDEDAVFIFQMASTFTTTAGRQVILSGGAKASNVYWQVGTSATLGTTTAFAGTILADQAITLESGATVSGRVLARIAAVSLDSNTIVTPAP